jgi:hypothetical protein
MYPLKCLTVIIVLLCFSLPVVGQPPETTKLVCDNNLIESTLPPVIITFDHSEDIQHSKGKSSRSYWMKIRNNSKCALEIEVDGNLFSQSTLLFAKDENGQYLKNSNGGLVINKLDGKQKLRVFNESVAPIIHRSLNNRRKPITGNLSGCLISIAAIYSNDAALFQVSNLYFKSGDILEVRYRYASEERTSNMPQFTSSIRFAFNSIPGQTIKASTQKSQ